MDANSTFTVPHDGTTSGELSVIFEGDEEISRNCTLIEDRPNLSDSYLVHQTRACQIQVSSGPHDQVTGNEVIFKAGFDRMQNVSVGEDWEKRVLPSVQTSGSDVSASIHELYENAHAFNADSCSEVDASSDEAFLAQTKPNSEDGCSNGENVGSVASSAYSESYLGRTDIFRPMLSNDQRKMLGLGIIPGTPTPVTSSTPSSKASRPFSIDKNLPYFSTSSFRVNDGLGGGGGGGDADKACSSQTSNTEDRSLQVQNLHVGITAPSDTESMGPMMDGKTVSDSEERWAPRQKKVSFSDCEDPTKSRSFQNTRSWIGTSPATRFRYRLPRLPSETEECQRNIYYPSPFSTLKRKSLIRSHKLKSSCKTETVDVDATTQDSKEKDSDLDSNKSWPPKRENQDPVALSFSDGGTPIFRKNQELKALTFLSPQTLQSKKLETKMQSQMRGALFDYESKWASEDVRFRRKVKSLELEYENKFLGIVQNHNTLQEKLYGKLIRRIHKIEKRVKREALHGRLKEGNCFQISHDIGNIKIGD